MPNLLLLLRHMTHATLLSAAVGLSAADAETANPLLTESTLPFHYPRFDLIKNAHFLPAYEAGMAAQLAEVAAIASATAAPTFDNTVVALERSGSLFRRVGTVFSNLSGAHTNPEMQQVQRTLSPQLAAHNDAIRLNPALFARLSSLYERRSTLGLDPESMRLLERYYKDFVRAGAQLPEAKKAQLRALNSELATLQTAFTQNVLKERDASSVIFATREELSGLSTTQIDTAAANAQAAGQPGKFLLKVQNTTGQPPLESLTVRASRQRLLAASLARGSRGGDFDTRSTVAAIAKQRAERAALLGYPHHAAFQLEEQTIGGVERLNQLLAQLAPAAVANARREAADMQTLVDAEQGGFTVAAADWDFYTEQVRRARYAFDGAQLRPYYELTRVFLDGIFFAATKLYGLTFKERHDLPVYEPTVRVFDVFNADGSQLAIFLLDPYARANKNGGAWASAYVSQSTLLARKPVIANHLNIPPPPAGKPTLLTHDEVNTAFHEFGHALHHLLTRVDYPSLSGINGVAWDAVELPSQIMEQWCWRPEALPLLSSHVDTGEPLPAELLERLLNSRRFQAGLFGARQLEFALFDFQLHAEYSPAAGARLAETLASARATAAAVQAPEWNRFAHAFSHIFAGGYAAGYYSYKWAEVLAADAFSAFEEAGVFDNATAQRFRDEVLACGGSREAMDAFVAFRGRKPDPAALLRQQGLAA